MNAVYTHRLVTAVLSLAFVGCSQPASPDRAAPAQTISPSNVGHVVTRYGARFRLPTGMTLAAVGTHDAHLYGSDAGVLVVEWPEPDLAEAETSIVRTMRIFEHRCEELARVTELPHVGTVNLNDDLARRWGTLSDATVLTESSWEYTNHGGRSVSSAGLTNEGTPWLVLRTTAARGLRQTSDLFTWHDGGWWAAWHAPPAKHEPRWHTGTTCPRHPGELALIEDDASVPDDRPPA